MFDPNSRNSSRVSQTIKIESNKQLPVCAEICKEDTQSSERKSLEHREGSLFDFIGVVMVSLWGRHTPDPAPARVHIGRGVTPDRSTSQGFSGSESQE